MCEISDMDVEANRKRQQQIPSESDNLIKRYTDTTLFCFPMAHVSPQRCGVVEMHSVYREAKLSSLFFRFLR